MKRLLACALLSALLLSGCSYTVRRSGDPSFLVGQVDWQPGVTTMEEVAQKLGPPDEIRVWGEKLWFLYAFNYESTSGLVLRYYGNWFTRKTVDRIDREMIIAFDMNTGKLLYHGTGVEAEDRNFADF